MDIWPGGCDPLKASASLVKTPGLDVLLWLLAPVADHEESGRQQSWLTWLSLFPSHRRFELSSLLENELVDGGLLYLSNVFF